MGELFNRDVSVQVGTTLIASRFGDDDVTKPTLRMVFKIEKTGVVEPNTAELSIWNLAEKTRAKFQTEKEPVIIEAGYVGSRSQIFSGDLSYGLSTRQGTEWITKFQAGDGEVKYRSARINENAKSGAKLKDLFKKALEATGLGMGNIIDKANAGDFKGAMEELTAGGVLSGNAMNVADRLAKAIGLELQIRDGQQEAFKPGETTEDTAIRLTLENGLIGSPELGEGGSVKARSLLQGGLYPARKVEIIASGVDGFFKVVKVTHLGNTWGTDWYSDIEAVAL